MRFHESQIAEIPESRISPQYYLPIRDHYGDSMRLVVRAMTFAKCLYNKHVENKLEREVFEGELMTLAWLYRPGQRIKNEREKSTRALERIASLWFSDEIRRVIDNARKPDEEENFGRALRKFLSATIDRLTKDIEGEKGAEAVDIGLLRRKRRLF